MTPREFTPADLSIIPDAELYSEIARRRQAKRTVRRGGRKPIISTCECGQTLTARQRNAGCPGCGKRSVISAATISAAPPTP